MRKISIQSCGYQVIFSLRTHVHTDLHRKTKYNHMHNACIHTDIQTHIHHNTHILADIQITYIHNILIMQRLIL